MKKQTMTIGHAKCSSSRLRVASKTRRLRPMIVVHMPSKLLGVVIILTLHIQLAQSSSFIHHHHHQQQQNARLSVTHRLNRNRHSNSSSNSSSNGNNNNNSNSNSNNNSNINSDHDSTSLVFATLPPMIASTTASSPSVVDFALLRDNKIDDVFLESPNGSGEEDRELRSHNNQAAHYNQMKDYQHNTINLDNSLEESEMFSNNHQSSSSYEPPSTITAPVVGSNVGANGNHHHSRHTSYHLGSNSNINPQAYHFGKYSPNMFANNYNLNYIHSFLSNKPPVLPTTSSGGQHNSQSTYGLASQHQQPGAGLPFAYISASSALSAAVNSLQNTIAQKQQKLVNLKSRLDGLTGQSTTDLEPQQQQVQLTQYNNQNNARVGDLPSSSMCGRQQVANREPRVVGGNNTYEGEFPWAVSIQRHGNHHCGGVIVGRRWILTAAHCVRSQLVSNLAVRTGGHTLTRTLNGLNSHLEKDYSVEQIMMHDDFSRYENLTASQMKPSASTNNADIALIKLKQEILWNELAWPVCFPNKEAGNFSGHDATVIGWGKLNEKSEEFSSELQKVKLTIIDNKVCQNWFRQAGRDMPIDDRIICAGFKHGGKDACHGDSGGPLLSRINGQYVVVGVVSTGIGCARPLLPGLYSRVSSYIDWIEQFITKEVHTN